MNDLNDFVDRYVAVWNEPDTEVRRARIQSLWRPAGAHVNAERTHSGHAAIEAEVTRVYAICGASGMTFRCAGRIDGHHGTLRMDWELLAADGSHAGVGGTNLLLMSNDGRLQRDVQFDVPAKRLA